MLSHRACSRDILFLYRFLIAETLLLISMALHRRKVEKGHTVFFLTLHLGLLLCSDLSFSVIKEFNIQPQAHKIPSRGAVTGHTRSYA